VGIAAVLFAPSLDILGSRLLGDAGIQGLSDRTRIYGAAIAAFWRSPLVGLGPDGMLAAIGASVGYPLSPHNLFLEVLVGYGAVGFCAIFAFAWLQVRGCLALRQGANRAYASAAVLAFAAVVLTGLSLHGFRENELWVSLGLLWACQRAFIPDVPSAARRLGHRE
jgi:O-antigen ligase